MAAFDITAANAILKELYKQSQVRRIGYKRNPFLALVRKDTQFGGKKKIVPIMYGGNQGASVDFATAKANKTGGLYEAFEITRRKKYALTSIEMEAIYATNQDMGAFLKATKSELDNLARTASDDLAQDLWSNYGGARGVVGAVSTTTLTLANKKDVHKFSIGMSVVSSATDGTSGSASTNAQVISKVDRANGILHSATNWHGDFGVGDFLFREGDFGLCFDGVPAWLPATVSGSDSFNGVNRSVDTRLKGQYLDGSALTKEEAILDLDTVIVDEGGTPTHAFVNPYDFNALRKELDSRVVWDRAKSPDMSVIGFNTIALNSASGNRIQVVSDRCVPYGQFALLDMASWELSSLGAAPRILGGALGQDGYIYDSDADSVEVRMGLYGNLHCNAPGYSGMGKFHDGTV